ncbi:MBL fold metallo-hydrolase [Mariluticola halotolerans]|uniref:MBL fold metallo-hydrolase n=1 Tax=Mariluticola halotolerans TaxID=2909283 RepID=UPI0026E43D81|nr:MBL fold metallo-hydrolase [Mariluticola halotolerans]UJQ95005.1 MBL fold metallo-hydrolase [Mariluticola halotolerans]
MADPAQQITATILGCGSSGGVPRVGNIWGDCDPANPRNRRRRCSLLLTGTRDDRAAPTQIIIDTGCDLREQLLDANVTQLDAVLYTHEHADHTHGIDDLRVLALNNRKRVDVYFSKATGQRLREAFGYCFTAPPGSPYPPILNAHEFEAGEEIEIDGPGGSIRISAFAQEHGNIISLGFRIANFAYSCDLSGLPQSSLSAVSDLDVWVLDALRPLPHPSHLSLPESLALVERLKPRQTVLTNMHIDMDYAHVDATTPAHVSPAYDGMVIDVTAGKVLSR